VSLIVIYTHIDPIIPGFIAGAGLIIFLMVVLPKITKNKEFLAQVEGGKKIAPIIRQNPEFYKLRMVGIIMIAVIVITSILFIMIGEWKSLQYIVPFIVFLFMMYYARFLQKNPKTREYGQKLEQVEVTGFKNYMKIVIIGAIIIIITAIIILAYLFSYF